MTYSAEERAERVARTDVAPLSAAAVRRDSSQSGVSVVHAPQHGQASRRADEAPYPRRGGWVSFSVGFVGLTADDTDHEAKSVRYVTRWRLEKKNPGKSEPCRNPSSRSSGTSAREVPEKWQQAFVKARASRTGKPAFEAAGFKNAIVGRLRAGREQEDPDWDPRGRPHTATIRWLPSANLANAFGPHIHDPRSGEILEADVRMFHNVLKLVRDWYFVQVSPSDERARKLPMPDELMGELIQFVVAHEVGHSLGFPHNMKASSSYTIAQLRDPQWTADNGTAPSIMDYARFNYVAQPDDGAALMARIGPYDHFAAEWGYRQYADDDAEKDGLAAIVDRQLDNHIFLYGGSNAREDSSQQTEDLTGDAVEATRLGLANLHRVAGFLIDATCDEGEDYELLENMYGALWSQWGREMGHVANVVGGVKLINHNYGDADQRFFPNDPTTSGARRISC